MVWKTGGWTSYDEFQKAKTGMCSVLVRSRDLLGSRNCVNLDSKMEISAGRLEELLCSLFALSTHRELFAPIASCF